MLEIIRLSGINDWIDLDFVKRERKPEPVMRLGIQMHVAELSLSNPITFPDTLRVQRSRKAVHDWVQKTVLQPNGGESLNQVALDESVIRINCQQYWLYTAVDSEATNFLYVRHFSTYTTGLTEIFLHERREKHAVDDIVFLIDDDDWLQTVLQRHGPNFRYELH